MTFYWWSHWFWITWFCIMSYILWPTMSMAFPSHQLKSTSSLEYNHPQKPTDKNVITKLYQATTTSSITTNSWKNDAPRKSTTVFPVGRDDLKRRKNDFPEKKAEHLYNNNLSMMMVFIRDGLVTEDVRGVPLPLQLEKIMKDPKETNDKSVTNPAVTPSLLIKANIIETKRSLKTESFNETLNAANDMKVNDSMKTNAEEVSFIYKTGTTNSVNIKNQTIDQSRDFNLESSRRNEFHIELKTNSTANVTSINTLDKNITNENGEEDTNNNTKIKAKINSKYTDEKELEISTSDRKNITPDSNDEQMSFTLENTHKNEADEAECKEKHTNVDQGEENEANDLTHQAFEPELRTRKSKGLSAEYIHHNQHFINYSNDAKGRLLEATVPVSPLILNPESENEIEGNVSSEALSVQRAYFMDAGAISAICFTIFGVCCALGTVSVVLYKRRFLNKPHTLSEPDSSVYIDDSTMRDSKWNLCLQDNSDEMYSLDNDSFLNSLEAMTIQNYWTDTVKHTKL